MYSDGTSYATCGRVARGAMVGLMATIQRAAIFQSTAAKFNRAQLHRRELDELCENKLFTITQRIEGLPAEGGDLFQWRMGDPPVVPPDWLTIIGDAVHNYRACLDHLMWALTVANQGTTDWWTHFPIVEYPKQWQNERVVKSFDEIDPAHRKLIEDLQPERSGWQGPGPHPLSDVHALDITDKHKEFVTAFVDPRAHEFVVEQAEGCRVVEVFPIPEAKLEKGSVIGKLRLEFTAPTAMIEVSPGFRPVVQFEDGSLVLDRLEQIAAFIRRRLLEPLVPELDFSDLGPAEAAGA